MLCISLAGYPFHTCHRGRIGVMPTCDLLCIKRITNYHTLTAIGYRDWNAHCMHYGIKIRLMLHHVYANLVYAK
jgi:hypothetical protein